MLHDLLTHESFRNALLTTAALAAACALLSVFVVLRRWAFIGEGIAHAGFGGIGSAWLLSLALPALRSEAPAYCVAILFCLAVALSIGYLSRDERVSNDTAIGIFLVASLAWGFVALAIFNRHFPGGAANWENYLFGQVELIDRPTMIAGVCVALAVLTTLLCLGKEIVYYGYDPLMARVSGVPVAFVHYVLMILLALVIVIGMRLAGNLLVTALLVLPGATALQLSKRLKPVVWTAVAVSLLGCVGGLLLSATALRYVPSGPAMVLLLCAEFAAAYLWRRLRPTRLAA